MNIYFYDNYSSSYNRFGNRVSEKLINIDKNINIFYIHDNYDKGKVVLGTNLKNNVKIIPSQIVDKVVKKYPPNVFLCFSFRIPDVYWTVIFNLMKIPTFQVMHGIYVKKYKRSIPYLLNDIPRIFSYFIYLYKIVKVTKNKFNVITNLIKKDFSYVAKSKIVDDLTLSKTLILWGMHWKEWYIDNFGYGKNTNYLVCGSFDFDLLNKKNQLIENNEDSITYISQTIAEDGRIKKRYFLGFINNLYKFAKNCNKTFYIKLHPRANANYYREFKNLENVIITKNFPISNLYISHYSALLTIPVYLKKKIILVEFPKHSIPEEYLYMSPNIINYNTTIIANDAKINQTVKFSKYFEYVDDPFLKIAKFLLNQEK